MQVIPVNTNFRIIRTDFDGPVFLLTRVYCKITNNVLGSLGAHDCYLVTILLQSIGRNVFSSVDTDYWDLLVLSQTEDLECCLGFVRFPIFTCVMEDFAQQVLT